MREMYNHKERARVA